MHAAPSHCQLKRAHRSQTLYVVSSNLHHRLPGVLFCQLVRLPADRNGPASIREQLFSCVGDGVTPRHVVRIRGKVLNFLPAHLRSRAHAYLPTLWHGFNNKRP